MSRRSAIRLVAIGALVVALVLVGLLIGLPSPDELRTFADELGPLAAPGFVLLYAAACLFPLPVSVLTVAYGALFGLVEGTALAVLGATLGSTGAFALARGLGRGFVERFASTRVAALDRRIERNAFRTVFVARLVPVLPFTALSYTFGLSAVPLRTHLTATLLAIVPGTAMYVAVGSYGLRPVSWPFFVAVLAVVALAVATDQRRRRVRRRLSPAGPGPCAGPREGP